MGNHWRIVGRSLAWLVALGAMSGCGGSDSDEDSGGPSGSGPRTVAAPWNAYCVATFTEDTVIMDFGEPLFTARAGDEYLMTAWETFGVRRATMAYMTPKGPLEFDLETAADSELPFMSNCDIDKGVPYYAAFTDVTVYSDEELMTKICDLTAGTALRRGSGASGYSATSFSFSGPSTYQIFLNAFAGSCGGADRGYISVPETEVFGTTTWLVPIIAIIGPS